MKGKRSQFFGKATAGCAAATVPRESFLAAAEPA
jgi:hypothetical protein